MSNKIKNIVGISLILILSYLFFKYNYAYRGVINVTAVFDLNFMGLGKITLRTFGEFFGRWGIFNYFLFFYWIGVVIYYLFGKELGKGYYFWIGIRKLIKKLNPKNFNRQNLNDEERLAVLSILLKVIYIPLMLTWIFSNGSEFISAVSKAVLMQEYTSGDFWMFYYQNIHLILFYFIMTVDVTVFFSGYAFELGILKNRIKSVDSTLSGWVAAVFCYPIFNIITFDILGWYTSNTPNFVMYLGASAVNYMLTTIFGLIGIFLMGIYVRASISLGFKASNLTNRGIVRTGAYGYVRHPAYVSKNFFRMLCCVPLLIQKMIKLDLFGFLFIILALFGRAVLYHIRALTEERHLSQDPEYIEYKKKVKYMYIPYLI